MKKLGMILPLLASVAAAPAFAQDTQDTQGMGFSARVEARVGYDEVRNDFTVQNGAFTEQVGVSDVMFGLEAGVDVRVSRVLVGAYVGIDESEADDCVANPFFERTTTRKDSICIDAKRNVYAGGRLGLSVGEGGVLGQGGVIYAKGGLSKGKFDGSYTVTAAAAGQKVGQLFSGNDTVSGYHFGGGFEVDFTPNIYFKGEYVQHRYKDAFTDKLNLTGAAPLAGQAERFDPSRHQLVLGIGFRFGGR
jgi:opacity protein-like surface antigen